MAMMIILDRSVESAAIIENGLRYSPTFPRLLLFLPVMFRIHALALPPKATTILYYVILSLAALFINLVLY
jgi:hypothetical protein